MPPIQFYGGLFASKPFLVLTLEYLLQLASRSTQAICD